MTSAHLELLRECQDRALEREGIPMLLALVSEIGPMPDVPAGTRHDGERLATNMDSARDSLVPSSRDGDMGCVISVLQAVAYDDFGREGER